MPRNSFGIHFNRNKQRYGLRLLSAGLVALPAALAIAGLSAAGPSHAQISVGLPPNGSPLPVPSVAHTQILTHHNDNQHTGVNPFEGPDPLDPTRKYLTPATVKAGFGKLFQHVVDGGIYGQPLFVSDLTIRNVYSQKIATHRGVVFVTTANNSIYAFDADDNTGTNSGPLWFVNFNFLAQNISPVPGNAIVDLSGTPQTDIQPVIGIIGTPVIDAATSTMYVVVRTQEFNDYVHRLHAIDISTGLERFNSPINIYNSITGDMPSVPGTGDGTDGTNVFFDPLFENQRPALTLWKDPLGVKNSIVYVTYGSTENIAPYHGWIFGYDTTNLTLVRTFNSSPNSSFTYVPGDPPTGGGFDMAGNGLATDAAGNIYASTGLGAFDANAPTGSNSEYGESILRLDPSTLTVADYFTPYNYQQLNILGLDLGAGAVVVLPDSAAVTDPKGATHTHLLAAAGNEGKFYLLDRDKLGKKGIGSDTGVLYSRRNSLGAVYGAPAYFNGELFYHAAGDVLRTFKLNKTFPYITDLTPATPTTPVYDFPGAIPSVSANGTTSGIIWEIEPYHPPVPNPIINPGQSLAPVSVLRAYDAANPTQAIWSSNDSGGRDGGGPYIKYSVPTAANGKVFVGSDGVLTTYGPITKPAPANGLHYVVTGPTFLAGWASSGQFLMANLPTLTPNIKYDFSVTAVGADGKPIKLTQTASVSVQAGTTKLPQTSVKFNNSSNATFTTNFPYVFSAFNVVVSDPAGNSGFALVQTSAQSLFGFDHFVLRAPITVRSGQLTTVLVTAANSLNVPVPLPVRIAAVYDTLPAGIQPYDADINTPATWGLLPNDNDGFTTTGQVPAATSTTGFAFEFQWGGGDFDVLPAFEGNTFGGFGVPGGQLTAGIPVRLYGVGRHVIVLNAQLPPSPVSNATIQWFGSDCATAIVNVIP